jgi:glyoxylase-like metal-dependent hydrolase (beta-lactamase superfamily II)
MSTRLTAAFMIACAASSASAQPAPTMLESYQRAKALIDSAVKAHGGVDALRASSQMRIQQEGFEHHRTQGARVAPPYDSTIRRSDVMVDLARNRAVNQSTRGWPGGFSFTNRLAIDGDKQYTMSLRNHSYSVASAGPIAQQFGTLSSFPQWYLLSAVNSDAVTAHRYLGHIRIGANGPVVEAIHYNLQPQGSNIIGLDPATYRLRVVMGVGTDVFTGVTDVYTEFLDWKTVNGVLMPERTVVTRAGERTSDMRLVAVTPGYSIADSLVAVPAGYALTPPQPPSNPSQELAPGVWLVGSGSKTLLVSFNDHLVAIDAPTIGSAEVITRAATLAPGKPIRFVVPTHHHDDHFSGVRHHVANGATVVTTPGNLDYLRRIMNAPVSLLTRPENQARPSSTYPVETISGEKRVFTDGSRTLEIHRIASPHAAETLIAWLPAEGILFQADLIQAPAHGAALRGANAETTTHLASVIRAKGWNVRVFAGAHSTVASPATFDELVALPIIPPDLRE